MKLTDKKFNEVLKPKMPAGFILIKEYQKWGDCPTIKNHTSGQVLFWLNGEFVQPAVMLADLKENWRPVASDEVGWYLGGMTRELNEAQSKFEVRS